MGIEMEFRRAWVVIFLTLRHLLFTRRVVATAVLASGPAILAAALAGARARAFGIVLFQIVVVTLFLQVVLIFVALVQSVGLLREEIDDNTLPYLLTRPISKPSIAVYKYLGYLAASLVLLLPPLLVAYAITEVYAGVPLTSHLDVLKALLVATVLGASAYGAFFGFISVLFRRPLWVGLLFGFVWESIIASIPGDVNKLSIIYYLRSALKGLVVAGPLADYPSDVSASTASLVLIGFTLAALILTMVIFQVAEFKQKA